MGLALGLGLGLVSGLALGLVLAPEHRQLLRRKLPIPRLGKYCPVMLITFFFPI